MPPTIPPDARTYVAAPDRSTADAFGGSFDLPPQMRDMSFEQLRSSDASRQQLRMAIGIQDYMNARAGRAVPVRNFVPMPALFQQWKRGNTPGATTDHFRAAGAGIPSMVQASSNAGATAVLMSASPRAGVAVTVRSQERVADDLGATRLVRPAPRPDPGYVRLRPSTQRNAPPATAADVLALAQQDSARAGSQDPSGRAGAKAATVISRASLRTKGY